MIVTLDFKKEDNSYREFLNFTSEQLIGMIKESPEELISLIEEVQSRIPLMSGDCSYNVDSSLDSYNFAIAGSVSAIIS